MLAARTSKLVVLASLAAAGVHAAGAQNTRPAAPPLPTVPYVNKNAGFEMQVPAGWKYDRTGTFASGGAYTLLRGASPNGLATLQILVFREANASKFPEWIDFFTRQLGGITGVERVAVKGVENADPPAAFIMVDAKIGVDRTRTLYYCVRFDPQTVWVFTQAGVVGRTLAEDASPTTAPADVEIPRDFQWLVSSLKIRFDPKLAREYRDALRRGRKYLAHFDLQNRVHKLRLDKNVRYYQILLHRKPVGFMTRRLSRERRSLDADADGKDGVRVRELSWRFAADGAAQFNQVDLFSSEDGETDLFELWNARLSDRLLFSSRDQAVREGRTLFSSYLTSEDPRFPDPRAPINVDPSYLGLAWARLLPALLGPAPAPMLAFMIYDSETRTLITFGITPRGPITLPAAPSTDALLFELREGYVVEPSRLYTDRSGNMLRFEADSLVLKLADQKTIEVAYGKRRAKAEKLLRGKKR